VDCQPASRSPLINETVAANTPWEHARLAGPASCAALCGIALLISTYNLSQSGPLFPDGPQYANGGAMIRDWLASGEYLHPYQFALKNYSQYPFFSVPYHPPGYPGLLGIWFLVVGTSYPAARCFIALCLGGAACSFRGILLRQGATRAAAMTGALLLLTTPEIVRWSRCTMSEIPALMFSLAATYCFVRWADTNRAGWCWAAFLLAALYENLGD
jgi:4-amino-4-deoxy-L-arabinose transferase-like glycosyltransferase